MSDNSSAAPASSATPAGPAGTPPASPAGTPPAAPANPAASLTIGDDGAKPAPSTPAGDDPAGTIIQYNSTGDAALDMALGFVGKLGIGPDHPAMQAAANGDHSLLKAHLASLGDKAKGWEQYIALAEKSHADGKSAAEAKAAATAQLVHDAAGGVEAWTEIQTWAKQNAEPAERAEVNAALKAGGMQAQAMVAYLKSLYEGASGTTVKPAEAVVPAAKANTGGPGQALSAAQYALEVQALRGKMGYSFNESPAYADLQARRLAGQRRGI
jgi:hypothetical protein